ncbi:MAG: AAA family ATPase [ANME-2 cluster archaeon]|nr:AAA family ATPase [ANME-2 cluster archaeon]
MKLLSLRLKNINSFRTDIHLDFTQEPLSSTSLFAITGPTGSGKTTLLDAISVALYNRTPRLNGSGMSNPVNLLSQGADEGASEVVFKVDGMEYLAKWRAKRNKKGDIKTEVELLNAVTGELITNRRRGKGSHDLSDMSVEEAVTDILGMDFSAFKRSILLAQGDFAAFLKASADERRQILEVTTGMGLFDLLKKNLKLQLDNARNEYELDGAGMEKIPAVSFEDIQVAKGELSGLERELQQLNESRTTVQKEKAKEQQRDDSHNKLKGNRQRQQDLLSMKHEMDILQQEMQRAQRAADIRSEMGAYQTEKKRLEDLDIALEKGRIEQNKAQQECSEAKSKYDTASLEFETYREEAGQKRVAYNEAAILETRAREQLDEANKRQQEADSLNAKLDGQKGLIKQKNDEISALESQLANDREFLRHNPLPADTDDLLTRASQIAAKLDEMAKAFGQKQESLDRENSEHKAKTAELEGVVKEGTTLDAKKVDILAWLDAKEKALESLTIEGDEHYWRTINTAWDEVRDAGGRLLESYGRLSATFDEALSTPAVNEFNKILHLFKHRIELQNQQILTANEKVKRCQAEEKAVAAANQAIILRREHLTTGEPCPVCGSIEHPDAGKFEPERVGSINEARGNVGIAEAELEAARKEKDSAVNELTGLARDRVKECDERLSGIETLVKEKDSAQNAMKLIEQQIQTNGNNIETLNRQIESTVQKIQGISTEIQTMEEDIAKSNEQFLLIIPPAFSGEPPASALEKFRHHISIARECRNRLEQNGIKVGELNASVVENTRRLEEDTVRYNNLLKTAAGYRDEGGKLLKQVKEMTGGMGVDAARSVLEASLKEMEEQRNAIHEDYRLAETQLTDITARLKEQEADLDRTLKTIETAKSAYMQALEDAGFESTEMHRACFREAAWLDKNKQVLQQYGNDVNTVEENIKAHEAVFVEKPFNTDDLPHILEREQELITLIEEKNSKKGELNKTIAYLTENLEKRREQEKKMEGTMQEMERWQKLAGVMPANSLRDFALQTMFDLLIRIANRQLSEITSRYALRAVDMKDMVVLDLWNAGDERPVETLSGGESFLVSLSLALALSELSSGRSRLESLFLDEGFGTLDSETLEAALYALESLRLSGRTVGIISHVYQLTRRIPVRIEVKKTGNGTSTVQVRG